MTTDRVDDLGALADQHVACPEDHGGNLLGLALHGHEAHGRTLRGLTDYLGIGRIILLQLDERLHLGRRDQLYRVAELADLPTPVVRAGASLHGEEAGGLGREESQHLIASQLLTEHGRTGGIRTVRLEDVLGQIQANCAIFCHGPLWWLSTPPLWHVDAVGGRPPDHWKTTTYVAGLRLSCLAAPFVLDRPINRDAFQTYVDRVLVPELTPGDLVVKDNLGSHKGPAMRAAIETAGARLLFLPPNSPDFNPIEMAVSKLKVILRKAVDRAVEELWSAIEPTDNITSDECAGFFAVMRHNTG